MKTSQSQNPQVKKLLGMEDLRAQSAAAFGLKIRRSPEALQTRLNEVAEARLARAAANLELTAKVLEECVVEGVDARTDAEFFRLTMRALKVIYPKGFLDCMDNGRIVEAYDLEQFQVFRNFRFMETCSYSLVEVMSFEWFELFERSKWVDDEIMAYATEKVWAANREIPVSIRPHHLRERFGDQQVVLCDLQTMAPLYSGPERPFGIISSCEVRVIPQEDLGRLEFI